MNDNRYSLPEGMPHDKWGHAKHAKTDPYGSLEFAIGSGDDFVCLDYAFFHFGQMEYVALHATVNSETGCFIQDFDYRVAPLVDRCAIISPELICQAVDMVQGAISWTIENGVRATKIEWNQDPYYFVRSLVVRSMLHAQMDPSGVAHKIVSRYSRSLRYGGKTVNNLVNGVADQKVFPEKRKATQ